MGDLQSKVQKRFSDVDTTQKKIEKELGGLHREVEAALAAFREQCGQMATDLKQQTSSALDEFSRKTEGSVVGHTAAVQALVETWKASLSALHDLYSGKASDLILSIAEKAGKIEAIYGELEKMQAARRNAETWLAGAKDTIADLARRCEELRHRLDGEQQQREDLGVKLEVVEQKLAYVEQFTHEHAFLGKKRAQTE